MDGSAKWAFRSYVCERRNSSVHDWYNAQSPKVQAEFDTALKYLRDRQTWCRPYAGLLRRECKGLVEIRVKVDGVQHRPLGFYGPRRGEFTIVFFATERDRKLEPPTACSIALGRKTIVIGDREERSCEWNV
jgi:hypothetical protein